MRLLAWSNSASVMTPAWHRQASRINSSDTWGGVSEAAGSDPVGEGTQATVPELRRRSLSVLRVFFATRRSHTSWYRSIRTPT